MDINQISCAGANPSSGFGNCIPALGRLKFDIAVPRGTRITNAQAADIGTYLSSLLTNDNPSQRGYLLGDWVSVEDSSAEATTEDLGDGIAIPIGEGARIWVRRAITGGLCQHKAMRRLNGQESRFDMLAVFASGNSNARYLIGGRSVYNSTTQEYELAGFSYTSIYAAPWGLATNTATAMYNLQTILGDVKQANEEFGYIATDISISDLPRVQMIDLLISSAVSDTVDVKAVFSCGGANLEDVHPETFDDPTAWVVTNQLGAEIPVTGVTMNGSSFRLALDDTDPAYVAATSVKVRMAPISVTSAAPFNVEWIESNTSNSIPKPE